MVENIAPIQNKDIPHPSLVGLSDALIKEIVDALHDGVKDSHLALIQDLSAHDLAELIQKIPADDRNLFLLNPEFNLDPQVFSYLDSNLRKESLNTFNAYQVAQIISELDSDDALDIIEDLSKDFQQDIIRQLSSKMRVAIEEGLTFPEDSAGRLMQREYVAIPQFWTVGKVIDYLRAACDDLPSEFSDLILIDPSYHVVGEVPLGRIIRAPRSQKIKDIRYNTLHVIPCDMDQEEVTYLFRREGLNSAPVIDADNRLIGIITVDDILDVIDEEAEEDILKLAGVEGGDFYQAILTTTTSRFRWLFVNLLTAIAASLVISLFDATLEEMVALAILMPIVASMGGNAGTQALTVAVRALATKELSQTNMMRVIGKETLVGFLNGVGFAVIIGCIAGLWFENITLGFVIAGAMTLNLIVAGLSGAAIPILLQKLGSDPALSSTVLLTTITDVVGFFGFLGLASLFLI